MTGLRLALSDPRGVGDPVLFVHGFSHNRAVWAKFAEALPADRRPIAVDLRGHGESPWPPDGDFALARCADDLRVTLDALELEAATLVGHSLGGNVSTLLAARAPERVRALVLVDTGPSLEAGGTAQIVDDTAALLRSFGAPREYREQLGRIHPQGDPEVLDRLAEASLVQRLDGRYELALDPGWLDDSGDAAALPALERELWTALAAVRCPTLVVRGGRSSVLSEKVAEQMVDEVLADGAGVTCARAGHAVMIDDAPQLAAALDAFLARLPASSS